MIFGECPVDQAEGTTLAHHLKVDNTAFKKGHILSIQDIHQMKAAGYTSVVVARPESGDVDENTAAHTVAQHMQGSGLKLGKPFTGRCNLYAEKSGLLIYDTNLLDEMNLIDEAITIAALPNYSIVQPGQLVVTVKIIPFFVHQNNLDTCVAKSRSESSFFYIRPFKAKTAALIQTKLSGLKETVLTKTSQVMKKRIEDLGSLLAFECSCAHTIPDVSKNIKQALDRGCDLVMIAGASAIVDRRDIIPAAIVETGGSIEHFGMPVDPGNLLLLAFSKQGVPILGLPGCARSPQINGLDWVLQRLHAGISLTGKDIQRMGAGGLLTEAESGSRQIPRNSIQDTLQIGAIVLADGKSSRMHGQNKLLEHLHGMPIIVHTLRHVLQAKVTPVVVVLGQDAADIAAVIENARLPHVIIVSCPYYFKGLSQSLKTALAALPSQLDGVVICLGDMPFVQSSDINHLIEAFNPKEGHHIILPVHQGQRGNPVLLGKKFFTEIKALSGDSGARHIIANHKESLIEVEISHDGVNTDIDTSADLLKARTHSIS
ncbi:MAG: molybdopterin-binding/glycosyltransferase family 2 protein [Alphaproteobacteria bacterium]